MDTSPPQNCVSPVSKRTSESVACGVIYSVNSVCIALDETCEGHKTVPQKELKKNTWETGAIINSLISQGSFLFYFL